MRRSKDWLIVKLIKSMIIIIGFGFIGYLLGGLIGVYAGSFFGGLMAFASLKLNKNGKFCK